jgi:alpha-galactosidase
MYASWGVDYLKYDWCDHGTGDARQLYSTMRDALYAAKRPVLFSLCEWGSNKPWEWASDVGHMWRTTGDVTDCYNCQGEYDLGMIFILKLQEGLERYAGPDHWNDPDMLEVGNPGLTLTESRAQFSLWCMLAAPLMAGNDLRKMSPEILKILTNWQAISINQDSLGKQAYLYMNHLSKLIYVRAERRRLGHLLA